MLPATHQGTAVTTKSKCWGAEGASSKDMLVPRIQLMQHSSAQVKEGKFGPGQLVHSTTSEVLAEAGVPLELIPIMTYREFLVYDVQLNKGKEKLVYKTKVLITKENEDLPWEDVENGSPIRRVYTIKFFVLVANRTSEMPFLISFGKSSLHAGKKLSTHFQMSKLKNVPPASHVWSVASGLKTWENNTFCVLNTEPVRATTKEEMHHAENWYEVLNQAKVKVDDGETRTDGEEAPTFGG